MKNAYDGVTINTLSSGLQIYSTNSYKVGIIPGEVNKCFFQKSTRFYSYFYDGRNNKLVRCVVDILSQPDTSRYKMMLYMNVRDFENYHECENTYWGYTEHYDTLTTIILKNQATPLENITINILASFLESEKKWGLMSGVSFRPFMPIALKMLFTKIPLIENQELINELKISKDDIRTMKIYIIYSCNTYDPKSKMRIIIQSRKRITIC